MSFAARVRDAWRALAPDQRLAATCGAGLFATMFLPWYEQSAVGVDPKRGIPVKAQDSLSAFQAFSFVEAAVLLVAAGVLVMLFVRAEGGRFRLPGGDGTVILAGGAWVALLIFIRQLDKPDGDDIEGLATTVGVQWGIFVAFVAGLALAYAGFRMRVAETTPPLPPAPAPRDPPTRRMARDEAPTSVARRRPEIDGGEQLSFDEQE